MRNRSNFSVNIKQCGGNIERMIRSFMKKTKKSGIVEEIRDRKYYKKPSEVRRLKRREAERSRKREERKHNRNNK